jgi:hypothetical protein
MGVIEGGTEFVVAAYAVTAIVLGGYAAWVILRFRRSSRASPGERHPAAR